MIIDKILDRKDGDKYIPKQFYTDCMEYGKVGHGIARAMDSGTENDVKGAICEYIIKNEYNPNICVWVCSVEWIPEKWR